MIPKLGNDTKQPTIYRKMSLINALFKIFESFLLDHLKLLTTPELVQLGLRVEYCTTIQLVNVIKNVVNNLKKRQNTAVALLDIEKVFDKV